MEFSLIINYTQGQLEKLRGPFHNKIGFPSSIVPCLFYLRCLPNANPSFPTSLIFSVLFRAPSVASPSKLSYFDGSLQADLTDSPSLCSPNHQGKGQSAHMTHPPAGPDDTLCNNDKNHFTYGIKGLQSLVTNH